MGNGDEPADAVLRRVIAAQGRLLRVERAPGAAGAPPRLRWTFDVGAVSLAPDAAGDALRARAEAGAEAAPELVVADEETPWWTLIGAPLARVAPREEGPGLVVQFRADDASPRILVLSPAPGAVRVQTLV